MDYEYLNTYVLQCILCASERNIQRFTNKNYYNFYKLVYTYLKFGTFV